MYIDDLVQDCSNSIANALELLQSCAKQSICFYKWCICVGWGVFYRDTWPLSYWIHVKIHKKAVSIICKYFHRAGSGKSSLWNKNPSFPLQWRHNEHDSVSNHQPHVCLLNSLFRRRSKKTSKLRVTGLCVGNSPVTGEFPAQMASNAENVSIWWRHHAAWSSGRQGPVDPAYSISWLLMTWHRKDSGHQQLDLGTTE